MAAAPHDDLALALLAIEGEAVASKLELGRRRKAEANRVREEVAQEFAELGHWHAEHAEELWSLPARLVWDEEHGEYRWR